MERSPWTMIFGISFNLTATSVYYYWLRESTHGPDHDGPIFLDSMHVALWWMGIGLLLVCIPLFIVTVSLEPGYLRPIYDFNKLVEVALDIGLHLDNLCSYCEVIKSETSFHCTICNKCVELFDHHCPFINNCLGYRNHKYFLSFIFLYTIFLLILITETVRHFIEVYQEEGISCLYTDMWCTVNIILVTMHMPVFFFQYYQQCGALCKRPENVPAQLINAGDYPTTNVYTTSFASLAASDRLLNNRSS